jgi:hypothetical protein
MIKLFTLLAAAALDIATAAAVGPTESKYPTGRCYVEYQARVYLDGPCTMPGLNNGFAPSCPKVPEEIQLTTLESLGLRFGLQTLANPWRTRRMLRLV